MHRHTQILFHQFIGGEGIKSAKEFLPSLRTPYIQPDLKGGQQND